MLSSRKDYLNTGLIPLTCSTPSQSLCCPICTDTPIDPVSLHPCNHSFCTSCITEWLSLPLRNTCPSCRKVVFYLDTPIAKPPADRLVLMSQAMTHAGLLGGEYLRFSDEIQINISDLYRAAAQANLWLGEEYHMAAAGPAVVERGALGTQIVAMGNLLRGFAQASGRAYSEEDTRIWKVLVKALYRVILTWHGRRMDAMIFPTSAREEIRQHLVQRDSVSEAFFQSEAQAESLRADLDVLLQYLAVKAAEAATQRESMRPVRLQPSVVDKVSLWFRTLMR